ncbi:MAG: helix-turn-helix domain-containing protein [bacterium]|nr:helix-turn-helix domain-containing protein [bacterium]
MELKTLGLTEYEAKIYKELLRGQRFTAKQLAECSTVPPTAVYPTLQSLRKKNLIQEFSGEQKQFEALDPKIAIPAYMENKKKILERNSEIILQEIEQLKKEKTIPFQKEILSLSLGQKASVAIYENMIKKAKKTIYIIGWRMHKIKDKYTFLHHFKEPIKRKVDVRLILTGGSEKAWELIQAYERAGIKIKYLPLEQDKFTMLIIDGEECKITLKDKTFSEKYNIHVHDTSLSLALEMYFKNCWKKAKNIQKDNKEKKVKTKKR